MNSDYLQKEKTEKYPFFPVPKMMVMDKEFIKTSAEAKLSFGLMLDRLSLSRKNGWLDENGNVFIYFTIEDVRYFLRCSATKAVSVLKELTKVNLIDCRRIGLGKPNMIYIKDFTRLQKTEFKNSENQDSEISKIRTQDYQKTETNNKKNNNTENSKTDPILSGEDTDNDVYDRNLYYKLICENLEADLMLKQYPYEKENIESIINLILDTVCSKRKTIRIAGDDKPQSVVKSQLLKLNSMHLEYVLECMRENTSKVKNIKQYILAALYNAPNTISGYYQSKVNYDLAKN